MAEIIDQQNTSGALGVGFGDTGTGKDYMCQGFIPTLDNVTAVSFWIASKSSDANIGYAVWIDAADASYFPTGTVFVGVGGFTEITNAELTTGSLVKYTLTTPATGLTPGNRYVICFAPYNTTTNAWAAEYIDWRASVSNPYANGRRVHGDAAFSNWIAPDSGNADIQFQTYGNEPASSGGDINPLYLRSLT